MPSPTKCCTELPTSNCRSRLQQCRPSRGKEPQERPHNGLALEERCPWPANPKANLAMPTPRHGPWPSPRVARSRASGGSHGSGTHVSKCPGSASQVLPLGRGKTAVKCSTQFSCTCKTCSFTADHLPVDKSWPILKAFFNLRRESSNSKDMLGLR